MDPYHNGFAAELVWVSLDDRDMFVAIEGVAVAVDLKLSVLGGEIGDGFALDEAFVAQAIGNEVRDADDFDAVLLGVSHQVRQPRH